MLTPQQVFTAQNESLGQSADVEHPGTSSQKTFWPQLPPLSAVSKQKQLALPLQLAKKPPQVCGLTQGQAEAYVPFGVRHPLGDGTLAPQAGMHTGSGQQVFELQIVPDGHWN